MHRWSSFQLPATLIVELDGDGAASHEKSFFLVGTAVTERSNDHFSALFLPESRNSAMRIYSVLKGEKNYVPNAKSW